MSSQGLPTGTVTFLFTDIEGSTRLVQSLGDDWVQTLEEHDRILRSCIEANGGVVVKTEGDSFFAVFETASTAVSAAVDAQRAILEGVWPQDVVVKVRMGLHTGQGTLGAADYVGLDVHRAARVGAAGHGGQIVVTEPVVVLAERQLPDGCELRDLGKHRLKDLLEPETLFQIVVEGLPEEFPPLRSLDSIPNNLPAQLTSFVGREREVAEAVSLLERARILTLTGPGGTGKTRLSLQVAAEVSDRFDDGVFFVGLSPLTEAELVPSAVLSALGLSASGTDETPEERLLEVLRPKRVLLVLDNFEHLLGAAPLAGRIAKAAPRSQLIVTSRAPLRVSGEQELPVPPLAISPEASVAEALMTEGVQLLVDRATAVRPDFEVTEGNVAAVVDLVNKLDGLPLAIELVASRLRIFPIETLAERLDSGLLGSGSVDLPERQRTIANTIAWSYDLLDDAEKRLFARLSVYAGGARIEEIEGLCAGWDYDGNLFTGLERLVDHSLLRVSDEGGLHRFRMLHVIREFAAGRLDESGEVAATKKGHLEVYVRLVEQAASELLGRRRKHWLDVLEADHDNIRTSIDWGQESGETDLVLRITAGTWRFWQARGHLYEADRRLSRALEMPGGDPVLRAKALEAHGGVIYWLGDLPRAAVPYQRTVEIWRGLGDRAELANALYNFSSLAEYAGYERDEAIEMIREARTIWSELDDKNGLANVAWVEGISHLFAGEYGEARPLFMTASENYQSVGNEFGYGWAQFEIAESYRRAGDPGSARPYLMNAMDVFLRSDDISGMALVAAMSAAAAQQEGRMRRAYKTIGGVFGLIDRTGVGLARAEPNLIEGLDRETTSKLTGDDREAYEEGAKLNTQQLIEYIRSNAD